MVSAYSICSRGGRTVKKFKVKCGYCGVEFKVKSIADQPPDCRECGKGKLVKK
jgi:hypothetical protein